MKPSHIRVSFRGMDILIHESSLRQGYIVVDFDTTKLEGKFQHTNGVPKLRIFVNDEMSDTREDGGWDVEGPR